MSLRAVFAGRRGRLLLALLFAEFGAAVQSIAYSTVLPLASAELDGSSLYGAVLTAGSFTTILVLATGRGPLGRLSPMRTLLTGTVLTVGGVVLSAAAVSMMWILVGTVMRGLAGGLLVSFGLTAIGALFDDRLRPRVMGLFAVVWLLPSLVGPVINAAIAVAFGWRAAMVWPAIVVLAARLLIGRDAGMIPWRPSTTERLDLLPGAALLVGLALAGTAPARDDGWGIAMLVTGLAVAVVASLRILRSQVDAQPFRWLTTSALFGLCLAFFGGSGVIALAVVDGMGHGAVASSVAVGAALVTWSLTGLRPPAVDARLRDATVVGLAILTVALAVVFLTLTPVLDATTALVVLVVAWSVAGLGMGLAYPRVSAEAMNGLAPERVSGVATAVALAETAGTAVGALIAGGTYSLASAFEVPADTSIGWAFLLLAAAGGATLVVTVTRRRVPTPPEPAPAGVPADRDQ